MINAGIFDGDIVVVKRQETAEDGDIVVAVLTDEATLKRFFREEDQVRLQPENDLMEPIYHPGPSHCRKGHRRHEKAVIAMDQKTGAVESLAVFLARFHPGDRCICCGIALQPVDRGPRMGSAAARRMASRSVAGQQESQAVECPHCGCEISEETAADCGAGLKELHPAA